jgi:hypothetical protein
MRFAPAASLALLAAANASAHSADLVYAQLSGAENGALDELVTMTAASLGRLAPVDAGGEPEPLQRELDLAEAAFRAGVWEGMPLSGGGSPCRRSKERAVLRPGYVELDAHFVCGPGELSQVFRVLSVLPAGYKVAFQSDVGGARSESYAFGDQQMVTAPNGAGAEALSWLGWARRGALHILTEWDHLAFLAALIAAGANWRRLWLPITSFTLAHSLTLGLAAMGIIPLDAARERWAEVAIAGSIVYVAAENLWQREPRQRWAVALGFGLIHGLGFASALRSHGLGPSPWIALSGFNVGVEAGQACVLLALWPVMRMVERRPSAKPRILRVASMVILAFGLWWMVRRIAG